MKEITDINHTVIRVTNLDNLRKFTVIEFQQSEK